MSHEPVASEDLPSTSLGAASEHPVGREDDRAWRRERRWWHAGWLAMSVMVLLLSVTMTTSEGRRVHLPGVSAPMPEICMTKVALGFACPGCGMTRAFISLGHGRWTDAWAFNPASYLLYPLFVFQIPWRIWQLRLLAIGRRDLELPGGVLLLGLVSALMIAQWVWRWFNDLL